MDTLTCRSKSSEIKVKWNCNGYASCHLHASNGHFGNPCANISKYLEVRYHCVKNIAKDVKDKPIVAFNAYTSQHLVFKRNTPVNVVYDKLYYNYGDAYNPQSGFFIAPSAGLYIFTWASVVVPRKIFDTEILVNGKRTGLGNCNNESSSGYENCASTFPLVLNAGDKVNIRTVVANYLHGGGWSSFKGWKA
uniref:C1q domain-containing protein n=1 Tax=Magallana gigas TaxID=29159 RepID=A0A8W8NP32_MAGGI